MLAPAESHLIRMGIVAAKPRRPRRARKATESEKDLHATVFEYLTLASPRCVWFPVPNGAANLGKRVGGMLKARGAWKAGVSDYFFGWSTGALGIELKVGKNGQNDDQKKFERECHANGVPYRIARSLDEVIAILKEFGRL